MKFADAGEARLQHLDVEPGGDRLHVIGGQPREEAVHDLAPTPEIVSFQSGPFCETRHGTLESVRMEVRHARYGDAGNALGRLAGCRRDGCDATFRSDVDQDALFNAAIYQGGISEVTHDVFVWALT